MSNPFPGMNPFLEDPAHWPEFHFKFINYWEEAISDALPPEFEAKIGERVYLVEVDPDARKLIYPDVGVSQGTETGATAERSSGGVATLEPITVPLEVVEGPRETFIEILHRP